MNNQEDFQAYMYFNQEEAKTIEAIASRFIPSEENSPGAREAGAVIFIDRSLSGFYSHLQTFYRKGLALFEQFCEKKFGKQFAELSVEQQDEVLHDIDQLRAKMEPSVANIDEENLLLVQFFSVVYEHTIEGTFGDPIYGGNRDGVGWKMIGFPGAQWRYSPEQMQLGYDSKQIEIKSLADIQKLGASALKKEVLK
ncbi:gluconate 2-dehydrogenase subunit 3 family protein [Bacillus canaveralius]|uniref:gluconate 2-dehydrogenase subunit 3 family protein n=1 Tax=Bacillus canaveralius TaxID=1403243 RepID=UPI001C8C45D9|nr:gluconate 2-dehydrogenase subunit 3 family protein [Bacillus canaveralius]